MLIVPNEFQAIWDEIEKQMCPPALTLHLVRLEHSPKGVDHPSLYQTHAEWFADHSDRTIMIRRAVRGEADNIPYDEDDAQFPSLAEAYPRLHLQSVPPLSAYMKSIWKTVPPLWMKVQKLRRQTFEVSAIYRGAAFFPVVDYSYLKVGDFRSDDALIDAYEKMNASEGMDVDAMKVFQQKVYERSCSKIGKPKDTDQSNKWTH